MINEDSSLMCTKLPINTHRTKHTSCTSGTMIIKVDATYAHPLLSVVHTKNPLESRTGIVSIDPGQIPIKRTVNATPAIYAVNFAALNFLITISSGGRSWKQSPSSRFNSPCSMQD